MQYRSGLLPVCASLLMFAGGLYGQPTICAPSADFPGVRAEGLTERIGDIIYNCTSTPNATITGNFLISLNVNLTNRLSTGNTLTGIVFTADNGAGPQPILVQPVLNNSSSLVYNGVTLTFSTQGSVSLRVAGIRANATQVSNGAPIVASLGITSTLVQLNPSQLTVAVPARGLFAGYSSTLVCSQSGSLLPSSIGFANLILAGTAFASTRVTEGFADAFTPRSAFANFNADSGQRIIVQYAGFPAGARLFVPDVVAGSDAITSTAGGDFELPASGGAYAPSSSGSLLLARVNGADANGAGGNPVFLPGAIGSGTVAFDSVSELSFVNGNTYAVYEVVDANPFVQETAQFPTFLGLAPNGNATPVQTTESVFFAPVSTVGTASVSDPLPRFSALVPLPDCTIIGDCSTYLPNLFVSTAPIQFTAAAGSPFQEQFLTIQNNGGGQLQWSIGITYGNGSAWLSLNPSQGTNRTDVRVDVDPRSLTPGIYQATLTVVAGAAAAQVPVTLAVTQPVPAITSVLNSASLLAVPVVPGSLTTLMGSGFSGKNVSATFDGNPATILFNNATQINLLAPSQLSASSSKLIVTVDGLSSAPDTVTVAPFEPAIFPGAIANQDSTVNSATNGAAPGSIIYLFATGLSGAGVITGHIATEDIPNPYYAGPAPTLIGVQQVNLQVPSDLSSITTQLYVCGTAPGASPVCSAPMPFTIH
jgi:uncharacterized protein (TIGR03437 family)